MEEWVYYEAREWLNVALLCEKLNVLPYDGGVFDQDEQTIARLLAIFGHLDEWRELEIKKASQTSSMENRDGVYS